MGILFSFSSIITFFSLSLSLSPLSHYLNAAVQVQCTCNDLSLFSLPSPSVEFSFTATRKLCFIQLTFHVTPKTCHKKVSSPSPNRGVHFFFSASLRLFFLPLCCRSVCVCLSNDSQVKTKSIEWIYELSQGLTVSFCSFSLQGEDPFFLFYRHQITLSTLVTTDG